LVMAEASRVKRHSWSSARCIKKAAQADDLIDRRFERLCDIGPISTLGSVNAVSDGAE
jgi:hypothetical protein